jgi:hypothetical protein
MGSSTRVFILEYDTDTLAVGDYEAVITVQFFGTIIVNLKVTDYPVRRVSVSTAGAEANGDSWPGAISSNGQHAAFYSDANNLVANDTNGKTDVFVHSVVGATTTRVSISTAGVQSNGYSKYPDISVEGRYVVFASNATNLVDGRTLNGFYQVYLHDRDADNNGTFDEPGNTTTTLVSRNDTSGLEGNGDSLYPTIVGNAADGYYLVYQSAASNIDGAANDTNGVTDIFRFSVAAATTVRVSVSSSGTEANGNSIFPSATEDGRFVVFQSEANNLIAGDSNSRYDIFLRNIEAGLTSIVTRNDTGELGNGASVYPSIGTDGNNLYVSYSSKSTNLVADDVHGVDQIYVQIEEDPNN